VSKRLIIQRVLPVFCTVLVAALPGCSPPPPPPKAAADQLRAVKVARAEMRPLERIVIATGSLAARERATLSVKVPGRLESLAVDLGSSVNKGDLIAQLEQIDYELRQKQAAAALAQARARIGLPLEGTDDTVAEEHASIVKQAKAVLEEARKNRERVLNLSKEGISSKSELDTVEAAYAVALNRYEAALEEARTLLAVLSQRRIEFEIAKQALRDTTIVAPFDGSIQERTASAGEYVQLGSPVATLVQADPLRLRVEVPERQSIFVRTGQTVRVLVEGDKDQYTGRIARLSPALDESNRMLVVEADVPNRGSLRPGLFVRAHIVTTDQDPGVTVPSGALVTFAGLEKVFIVQDGKAAERTVTTGRSGHDWVEIKTGVRTGDVVVLDPGNLRTGDRVQPMFQSQTMTSTNAVFSDEPVASGGP
jgi:RND family efflux transporter MFP subunit